MRGVIDAGGVVDLAVGPVVHVPHGWRAVVCHRCPWFSLVPERDGRAAARALRRLHVRTVHPRSTR